MWQVSIYHTEHISMLGYGKLGAFTAQQYASSVEWNIFYSKRVVKKQINTQSGMWHNAQN